MHGGSRDIGNRRTRWFEQDVHRGLRFEHAKKLALHGERALLHEKRGNRRPYLVNRRALDTVGVGVVPDLDLGLSRLGNLAGNLARDQRGFVDASRLGLGIQ